MLASNICLNIYSVHLERRPRKRSRRSTRCFNLGTPRSPDSRSCCLRDTADEKPHTLPYSRGQTIAGYTSSCGCRRLVISTPTRKLLQRIFAFEDPRSTDVKTQPRKERIRGTRDSATIFSDTGAERLLGGLHLAGQDHEQRTAARLARQARPASPAPSTKHPAYTCYVD